MKYEDKLFVVYYNECDKSYINELLSIIKERMPKIMSFFHIKYDEKITIKLYDSKEKYKNNIEASFAREAEEESIKQGEKVEPRKYQEWMIADTNDGNINMLSFDLVLAIEGFKNYTKELFLFNSCHEFVHKCQQKVGSTNPGWFWEVLATVLGNPECQHETNEHFTIEDLDERFDEIDGYGAAYKIGRYLFANYDEEYISSLVTDNDKMYETIREIIDNINNYTIS